MYIKIPKVLFKKLMLVPTADSWLIHKIKIIKS